MSARAIVVVPCFREERRLRPEGFRALHAAGIATLFVDDGSDDATWSVIQAMCAGRDLCRGVRLTRNVGKGEAVRSGLNAALAEDPTIVGYLDADLSTSAHEMVRVVGALDDPAVDLAIGSRVRLLGTEISRQPLRHYLGRVFATAASAVLRLPVYDTQCGAKAFRVSEPLRAATARPFRSRWAFDVELLARLIDPNDHRAVEVPLRHWTEVGGGQLAAPSMLHAGMDLTMLALRTRRRQRRSGRARDL